MARPKELILVSSLLNEPDDEVPKEEYGLAGLLSAYAPTSVVHLNDLSIENLNSDATYLFRCIYGASGTVERDVRPVYKALTDNAIEYINEFTGKGDQRGKGYLLELYSQGFPVVTTFNSTQSALAGAEVDDYILKPLIGGSSRGQIYVTRKELTDYIHDGNYIIQPKMHIAYETSYLFINNEFQHALKTRSHRWDMVMHEPSDTELAIAKQFVAWNPIKGIQRVDCLFTTDGQQLLLELEDWCPYLSLYETANVPKERFAKNLAASLGLL